MRLGAQVHFVAPARHDRPRRCLSAMVLDLCDADLGPEEGEPGPCVGLAVSYPDRPGRLGYHPHVGYGPPDEPPSGGPTSLCDGVHHATYTWHEAPLT